MENNYVITGNLLIAPGYEAADTLPLAGQRVFIRVDSIPGSTDTATHFYNTTSRADGGFTFYVPDTAHYAVFSMAGYKSSPTYVMNYYGIAKATAPFDGSHKLQLVLTPDTTSQNGMDITTLDATGSRIARTAYALYASQVIALADAESLSGNGALLKSAVDSMGRGFISNLPEGRLYMNARMIAGKDTFLTVAQPLQMRPHLLLKDTLRLVKK